VRLAACFVLGFAWVPAVLAAEPDAADRAAGSGEIEFNRDIRPILSENCFFCHGPDSATREAGLRLDVRADAVESSIEPGDASASELVSRIFHDDADWVMPPPTTGRRLTEDQKELLRRWIDSGAEYQSHWSFVAPKKADLPTPLPAWAKNPIDHFVLEKMRSKGLEPQAEADRETLIRRVTFDLTGLPPTLKEIDAFLNDASSDAYEQLVDRLLASSRYGERMTADWLDVARYSDSYGMQVDRDRRVWPYRDWVIDAFNSGMPYDRFITEQLAGDLLPGATDSQILATAFNRLHPQECEGGSVPEEFRIEYVADRTQTVVTAFLGLTLECCRCHDHKYDPLSQREYYQLTSFFDNVDEAGLYSYFTESCPTPTLTLPSDDQRQQLAALNDAVERLQRRLPELRSEREPAFQDWLASLGKTVHAEPVKEESVKPDSDRVTEIAGQIAYLDFEAAAPAGNTSVPGYKGQAVRIGGDDAVSTGVGNFHRWQPFTASLWMRVPDHKERAVVFHRSRAWTDAASRGYELLIEDGHLLASLIHFWPGNQVAIRAVEPIAIDAWVHVTVSWDGSSRAEGLAIYVNGQPAKTEVVRDALTKDITGGGGDEIAIGARFRDRGFIGGLVDEFRVFDRRLSDLEIAELASPGTIDQALLSAMSGEAASGEAISEATIERLRDHYFASVDTAYAEHLSELRSARQAAFSLGDSLTEIMVMREMPDPRQTYLLARGAYDAATDPVESRTPESLPPWNPDWPENRLGFAKWLVDPDHPLTSRVAVNRFWQSIFGRGLVDTPEDFGSQGALPSHPELLDWLAVDFIQSGWDVKGLLRLMVTSATYRQASGGDDAADPENIYLSRAPRYRWPAEMLRDNALAISGLLAERIGGEPAKPYEVESSFKPVGRDKGDGLYRRSLYTYWNRTGPAPALTTLDAAIAGDPEQPPIHRSGTRIGAERRSTAWR